MSCRATDNRIIERLWRSQKYECIFLNAFDDGSETRVGIAKWIACYNAVRSHSTHGISLPDEADDRKLEPMKSAAPCQCCASPVYISPVAFPFVLGGRSLKRIILPVHVRCRPPMAWLKGLSCIWFFPSQAFGHRTKRTFETKPAF